ncbi:MAG: hypothetical protein HWN67_18455 [Candidatus Helarchaeota archaeon]|nr:hypothetical protein [Candidatus Helarchaeota archaeon]
MGKTPIFGILALIFSILGLFIEWWLGIVGIVLGFIGLARNEDKTLCTIAIIIGIAAVILHLINMSIKLFK